VKIKNKIMSTKAIIDYKVFGKRKPLAACWLITNRCNFNCSYCNIWKEKSKEISTKDAFSLIDQLVVLGAQRLSIFGGEPLLREDIGQIIEHSVKSGLFTGLGSNGILVPQKIRELRLLDMLHISFDGPVDVHNKQIKKNTFEKVLKGIKVAKDDSIKTWTTAVLTKNNIDEIDYILSKMYELNVPIYFQPVMYRPLSGGTSHLFPEKNKFKKAILRLIEEKKRNSKNIIINSITNLKYMVQWPNYPTKLRCHSKYLRAEIDCKGNVVPCSVFIGSKMAMNFTKVGLKKAFDNLRKFNCKDDMSICKSWDYANMEFNHILKPDLCSIKNALSLLK